MIYDLKTTIADALAVPTAVTAGAVFGTPLDLSTLQPAGILAPTNVTPQWPLGATTPGVQPRNIGNGEAFYLMVRVRNASGNNIIVGATGTFQVQLWTADSLDLTTTNASQIVGSAVFANQTLIGGQWLMAIDIPIANMRRYIGLKVVVGTVVLTYTTSDLVDAFLTNDPAYWLAYAQPMLN